MYAHARPSQATANSCIWVAGDLLERNSFYRCPASCFTVIMETILEQQRRYHEEMERLMDAKTKEMLHKKTTVSYAKQLTLLADLAPH